MFDARLTIKFSGDVNIMPLVTRKVSIEEIAVFDAIWDLSVESCRDDKVYSLIASLL